MRILTRIAEHRSNDSPATRLRRRRFALFRHLVSSLERPFTLLDVGGTPLFWETMQFADENGVRIVLLNMRRPRSANPNFEFVAGDARNMQGFGNKEFDVVFSNSVIEHVGGYDDQRRMAEEVRRVGKRYFLQTPNRYFPLEPHFLFPFFQFLPQSLKVLLVRHFQLGFYKKRSNKQDAAKLVASIRLLTEKELRDLFPGATIYKERILGLTKSFLVCGGWDKETDK